MRQRFEETVVATGTAHRSGSIVLLWPRVLAGGRGETPGMNLVLHEFAHHLDSLDGEMAGLPPLPSQNAIDRWNEVIDFEYQQLVEDVEYDRPGLLRSYGASNKAEFFAVATECFYELPRAMQDDYPELYALLADFYRIDPSQWWPDAVEL
jgi:Mlc titration factor MtfA (ptsG expression regulator)